MCIANDNCSWSNINITKRVGFKYLYRQLLTLWSQMTLKTGNVYENTALLLKCVFVYDFMIHCCAFITVEGVSYKMSLDYCQLVIKNKQCELSELFHCKIIMLSLDMGQSPGWLIKYGSYCLLSFT